ncbi:MAG: FAD-binding oxidoreductase, partial [Actinobacteria bacterium]|nr:FAD-binding oxidoreductase [Actinomycetota bacterium]
MKDMKDIVKQLIQIAGKKYVITPDMTEYHAYTFGDATMYRSKPDVVVYPAKAEEIQKIVQLACKHKIPVITGAGMTGLSGGAVTNKGILLNMKRMNSIKAIDTITRTVVAEPGITCGYLNEELKKYNLTIPVAPASQFVSTLGGNIAQAAGGTLGMSKGTFKHYLLTMKVIDGLGNLFNTGVPFTKQSTGPDLTALFLCSEGTLGIITEITLRCELLPEDIWTVRCSFSDEAVLQTIHEEVAKNNINLYSFEYIDARLYSCFQTDNKNMLLLLQTAGSVHDSEEQMKKLVGVLKKLNPLELTYTNDPDKTNEIYTERRNALGAIGKVDYNKPILIQFDPVLPLSKFALGVKKMRELAQREQLDIIIYGHAGDGNLHPTFIVRDVLDDKIKAKNVIREYDKWVEEQGGCYAGEHAVGFFLGRSQNELRPDVANYLRVIKSAFDPNGILNPGKIIDIEEGSMEIPPILEEYSHIGKLSTLCAKCHLCKNDSLLFAEEPFEHNTIRGRISMIDAACRGAVKFSAIKPFIAEMEPWTKNMNCPTHIKNEMEKL